MSSFIRYYLEQYRRPLVAKSSKLSKPFLPTSQSPEEDYLKEGEDRPKKAHELWEGVANNS